MASIHIKTEWSLTLTTEELRLVLKALGERLKSPKETEEAKILGDLLSKLRANSTEHSLTENEKLLQNIDTTKWDVGLIPKK